MGYAQFLKKTLVEKHIYYAGDLMEFDDTDHALIDWVRRKTIEQVLVEVELVEEPANTPADDFPDVFQEPEQEEHHVLKIETAATRPPENASNPPPTPVAPKVEKAVGGPARAKKTATK